MRQSLFLIPLLVFLASCSLLNRTALRTTGAVIESGSDESMTEGNWENFKVATPANLKMLEGLWFADKENKTLLTLLIKGYSAYAFAVSETEALEGLLLDEPNPQLIHQAILNYEKAIFYGEKYMAIEGIKSNEFWDASFPTKLKDRFDDAFSKEDHVAMLYFGQAVGSSINLQRSNISKMSYMNHAFKTIDWVCKKDPELEHGSCGLFSAVLTASIPSIMGGSQQKAREQFQTMMKKMPYNLLVHLGFIQYHLIPMMEEEEYNKEVAKLNSKVESWYKLQLGEKTKKNKIFQEHRKANLYNAIARERLIKIEKVKEELF